MAQIHSALVGFWLESFRLWSGFFTLWLGSFRLWLGSEPLDYLREEGAFSRT